MKILLSLFLSVILAVCLLACEPKPNAGTVETTAPPASSAAPSNDSSTDSLPNDTTANEDEVETDPSGNLVLPIIPL